MNDESINVFSENLLSAVITFALQHTTDLMRTLIWCVCVCVKPFCQRRKETNNGEKLYLRQHIKLQSTFI